MYLKCEKCSPFGHSLPVWAITGSTCPPGCTAFNSELDIEEFCPALAWRSVQDCNQHHFWREEPQTQPKKEMDANANPNLPPRVSLLPFPWSTPAPGEENKRDPGNEVDAILIVAYVDFEALRGVYENRVHASNCMYLWT